MPQPEAPISPEQHGCAFLIAAVKFLNPAACRGGSKASPWSPPCPLPHAICSRLTAVLDPHPHPDHVHWASRPPRLQPSLQNNDSQIAVWGTLVVSLFLLVLFRFGLFVLPSFALGILTSPSPRTPPSTPLRASFLPPQQRGKAFQPSASVQVGDVPLPSVSGPEGYDDFVLTPVSSGVLQI